MPTLREMMKQVLADGTIESHEVEALCDLIYADGPIDRKEAEFLVALYRRVERPSPGFDRFFYRSIKQHVLTDGRIGADKAAWLRRTIFADGTVDKREKRLVRKLRGEATEVCSEFEALYAECLE